MALDLETLKAIETGRDKDERKIAQNVQEQITREKALRTDSINANLGIKDAADQFWNEQFQIPPGGKINAALITTALYGRTIETVDPNQIEELDRKDPIWTDSLVDSGEATVQVRISKSDSKGWRTATTIDVLPFSFSLKDGREISCLRPTRITVSNNLGRGAFLRAFAKHPSIDRMRPN
jgi:hypothetical protein